VIVHGLTDNDVHPPRFGASQRLFGLYRGLARRHDVTVLSVVPNRNRGSRAETVERVRILRRKAWYTALCWRLERARLTPLFLAGVGHRLRSRAWLAELGGESDVLMVDLALAGLLEPANGLRVYHAHNVEYDHFRAAGPRLLGRDRWAERLRGLEARAVAHSDVVVAVSPADADRIAALYGIERARVEVVANGFDETAFRAPTPEARAAARAAAGFGAGDRVAVFVGSDHPHNREALALLVDRAMPRAAAAGVKLLAVGTVTRLLQGRREPWLVARPEVPDLLPALHAADVGLNPVLAGGGSNVKLPTYLAAGLDVLTTPHGLRGFESLAGAVTVTAPEAFAEALGDLRPRARLAGDPPPAGLAAYAWGDLGERLGESFAARLAAASAPARSPATDEHLVPRRVGGIGA